MDNHHHRHTLVLFGAATLAFVGIVLFAINSDDDDLSLEGTAWTVEFVVIDGDEFPPIAGSVVTASFADGEVDGLGGCNNYFGSYTTDGGALTVGSLASTRRLCDEPPGVSEQEAAYLGLLESAERYVVDGDRLMIDIADGRQMVYRGG